MAAPSTTRAAAAKAGVLLVLVGLNLLRSNPIMETALRGSDPTASTGSPAKYQQADAGGHNATISAECLVRRATPEYEGFCRDHENVRESCQGRNRREEFSVTFPDNVDITFDINSRNSSNDRRWQNSRCRTLWVSGMSEGFDQSKVDNGVAGFGDGFQTEYVAALHSALAHGLIAGGAAADDDDSALLQPLLFVITPPSVTKLSSYFMYLNETLGVKIIHIHELSFQDLVYRSYPTYRTNGMIGYFTRLDIPKIIRRHELFNDPLICGTGYRTTNELGEHDDDTKINDRIVLYTDNDVLFVNPLTRAQLDVLKRPLIADREKILMYGQDYLIDRAKPSNTGVMLIDVMGLEREMPSLLEFGERLGEQGKFPEHDQVLINHYYADPRKWKRENLLLPVQYNWKVYWHIIDPVMSAKTIVMIHFHGPKPGVGVEEIATCDIASLGPSGGNDDNTTTTNSTAPASRFVDIYKKLMTHAICCDGGKTAATVNQRYQSYKKRYRDDMIDTKKIMI